MQTKSRLFGIFETEEAAEGWVRNVERKALESDTHMNS
jgi:hypothetical protein